MTSSSPEPESTLPFLVRIPLGDNGVVLKAKDTPGRARARSTATGPRSGRRTPRSSTVSRRGQAPVRGASIDLALDRSRENRSQFVLTRARGRPVIF